MGANRKAAQARREPDCLTQEFVVTNVYGLHARPAATFAKEAGRFEADIQVERDGNSVSAKSIMGLMTLAAARGARLKVKVAGTDAEAAMTRIRHLFDTRFGVEDENDNG